MSSAILAGGHLSLRYGLRTLCNNQTARSASVFQGINKGLRRSKGVGFRGKEKNKEEFGERHLGDFRGKQRNREESEFGERHSGGFRGKERGREESGLGEKTSRGLRDQDQDGRRNSQNERYNTGKRETVRASDPKLFREKKSDSDEATRLPRRTGASRFNNPNSSFGKGSHHKPTSRRPNFEPAGGRHKLVLTEKAQRAVESDRMALQRNPDGSKISASRRAFIERTEQSRGRHNINNDESNPSRSDRERQSSSYSKNKERESDDNLNVGDWRSQAIQDYKLKEKTFSEDEKSIRTRTKFSKEQEFSGYSQTSGNSFDRAGDRFSSARGGKNLERTGDERPAFTEAPDKRMPLSIPYTTPASEFLYGTSVVETALTSQREPRRKLYKLYIHRGENGDNEARDTVIERLARKAGVEVRFVNSGWLRLMDKMSGGRPHNGYILEASPLPKLPILSLGPILSDSSKHGFSVALDYQSREEAAINGTSNFVSIPRDPSGRKPFVLLLDSIQDPGNLGGIIRTASFLGATAVAISTRNSASFTPVVLKASAGASEQVTLFSINKPAGFLENSKTAGWKIYAAVAPAQFPKPNDPPSTTTDELGDPLLEDPCILMLGNEGEGLRWNLRSKADCDLSIPGSGQRGGVDSLNVSVAAGVLCDAFLRNRRNSSSPEKQLETFFRPKKDLF